MKGRTSCAEQSSRILEAIKRHCADRAGSDPLDRERLPVKGCMVMFVLPSGMVRPAVIVQDFPEEKINLRVFADPTEPNADFVRDVRHDEIGRMPGNLALGLLTSSPRRSRPPFQIGG